MTFECGTENGSDLRIHKVGCRYKVRVRRGSVQLTGQIETAKTLLFKHAGPFFRFQGNTVGPGKTGGNEPDVVNIAEGYIHRDIRAFGKSIVLFRISKLKKALNIKNVNAIFRPG